MPNFANFAGEILKSADMSQLCAGFPAAFRLASENIPDILKMCDVAAHIPTRPTGGKPQVPLMDSH